MFQSIRIIEQCLDQAEDRARARLTPTLGEMSHPARASATYEAPRGEVFHYIRSDGSNRPVRHKVRAPSFMNVPTNRETVLGATVADATLILAAVDPCYCCTERMAVALEAPSGKRLWEGRELIRLSRDKTYRLMDETGWTGPQLPMN